MCRVRPKKVSLRGKKEHQRRFKCFRSFLPSYHTSSLLSLSLSLHQVLIIVHLHLPHTHTHTFQELEKFLRQLHLLSRLKLITITVGITVVTFYGVVSPIHKNNFTINITIARTDKETCAAADLRTTAAYGSRKMAFAGRTSLKVN